MSDTFKHSYKPLSKDTISLAVYNVGYQKCTPLYKWGAGVRDHYLIHHIIDGKGYYCACSKTYELKKGDTFIIYPNTEVSYWADANNPWEYYWVGFSGNDEEMLLKSTSFSPDLPVISINFGNKLKNAFLDIYNSKGNKNYQTIKMTGYLYIALSIIIKKSAVKEITDQNTKYVRQAIDFIQYNYSSPVCVNDIALSVGISRSQLHRVFIDKLNMSPMKFLADVRIRKACYLLKNTDLSIKSISISVGFLDNLYFSKVFHKSKGISPSEYRKTKTSSSL